MSDFSDHWLALRAPADGRARATRLLAPLRAGWQGVRRIIDLGAGTGANLRYLAPRLGGTQHWRCVDHDRQLLACLPERTADWATRAGYRLTRRGQRLQIKGPDWRCRVVTRCLDLANGDLAVGDLAVGDLATRHLAAGGGSVPDQGAVSGPDRRSAAGPARGLDDLWLPPGGLVTASALLDLVSAAWLQALLGRCQAARCRLLFALTYDGRFALCPPHPDDALVRDLVNRHQRGDKGLGSALGPSATAHAAACCRDLGWQVTVAASDWRLAGNATALQQALLSGWCDAARQLAPHLAPRLARWRRMRGRQARAGQLEIQVGHQDLIAVPAARSA